MFQRIRSVSIQLVGDTTWLYIIKLVGVYLLWKLFHHFLLSPSFVFYSSWETIVQVVGTWYAAATAVLLRLMGENVTQAGIGFQFHPSTKIVYVAEHCLAFPAMIVFSAAILFYQGSWKDKLWFIPMGLLAIIVINIFRLVFLGLTFEYFGNDFYQINHSYIYVFVTYSLIFLMIAWWMSRSSKKTQL